MVEFVYQAHTMHVREDVSQLTQSVLRAFAIIANAQFTVADTPLTLVECVQCAMSSLDSCSVVC